MEKKRILIVDDELDMRIFISTLFETSGYAPVAARNGAWGMEVVEKTPPDLIILDVMMPGEGGAHMYKQLRTNPAYRKIPIIMLSGVEKEAFFHYLKMLNINIQEKVPFPEVYMEKPPDPDELLKTAKELLE